MKFDRIALPLRLATLAAALIIAGCSTVRPPESVAVDVPATYREAQPLDGAWQAARPADGIERGEWWTVFGDPELSALIATATRSSNTLAIALARVREARAIAGLVDANRGVQVTAGAGPTRQGDASGTATQYRAQFNVAYEVDLFGKLADGSRAAQLDAEAQEAAYRSVLLALQADVAEQYFAIRC